MLNVHIYWCKGIHTTESGISLLNVHHVELIGNNNNRSKLHSQRKSQLNSRNACYHSVQNVLSPCHIQECKD